MFLWTAIGILFVAGGVWVQATQTSACYGTSLCNFMNLSCPTSERIFIFELLHGRKISNMSCSNPGACSTPCCRRNTSDCFLKYSDVNFGLVYKNHSCWNSQSCSSQVIWASTPCSGYSAHSTYAVADYHCLRSHNIIHFHRNTTNTASTIAIHYNASDVANYPVGMEDNKTWHCRVDMAPGVQRLADVILVKEWYTAGSSNSCSSVGWSGGPFLPCVPQFQYLSFNASIPFNVSVRVDKDRGDPNGWAVVKGHNGGNLTVRCGYTNLPTYAATTISQPSTSMRTIPTQTKSLSTVLMASFSSSSQSDLTTKHPTTGYHTTSTEEYPLNPSKSTATVEAASTGPDTGAVVGGVVAAVVVLVAAVLAVYCFLKRRRQMFGAGRRPSSIRKSSQHMRLTSVNSESPSSPRPSESGISNIHDVDDGDYDKIGRGRKPENGHVPAPSIVDNPRTPVGDLDYDRLGGKKYQSSSSNTAATYGRLGEVGGGGEVTDYSYDHLARGRQAAPDVIDSDYDTSALHVTSEGDYNVAGIPKKQYVITGSDYDTAEIVTSDGDYNRVDFQGKKQHVITGSDYDTAEIVTSEGDYNKVDFQGKKQKVITGSEYDMAAFVTSDNTESDGVTPGASTRTQVGRGNYEVAKPIVM